ncbi:hypothetical protein LWI29_009417 [Acer saccharum]|uniref:Uncharacterized protein n=1 Tax=Acer saccharum TaxID=4024 RepID=A0AA39TEM8_ACESA|nr:hypothetical protein LWI29_009417 [Acer saccharum]
MRILDIFIASFIPVLKVLLLTVLGLFLALQRVDILGAEASKHLNNVAFFVFSPSLIASSLANNLTVKSIGILWFMPLNILLTFIIGSALGWILVKITRTPRDLWGLIIGCCAAGNLGNKPLIIIPAVCKERGGPFGNADVCYNQGIAYSSLSMAISAIYTWVYVYNLVRIFSSKNSEVVIQVDDIDSTIRPENVPRPLLPLNIGCSPKDISEGNPKIGAIYLWSYVYNIVRIFSSKNSEEAKVDDTDNTRPVGERDNGNLSPKDDHCIGPLLPVIGCSPKEDRLDQFERDCPISEGKTKIIGFMVGVIPQLRKVLIGDSAPLRVVEDCTSLLGTRGTLTMKILDLFIASFIPVLKVLLLTALGLFLALDKVDILGEEARKHLNNFIKRCHLSSSDFIQVAFFVFTPALVGSSLAKYITIKSIGMLWFMPVNILITFIIGSALGWILIKITRAPRDLWGLVIGCCAAGNLGNMLFIIIPTVCKERGSPFGNANVCYNQGMAYSSLSMAIGAIFLWSYVYNIVRLYSSKSFEATKLGNSTETQSINPVNERAENLSNSHTGPLLPLNESSVKAYHLDQFELDCPISEGRPKIVGFMIGVTPRLQKVLVGDNAPLRVVEDFTALLGSTRVTDTFINNHRDHSDSVHCSANIGSMHCQSCHPFRVGEFRSAVPVYSSAAVCSSPSNTDR